MQLLWTSKSQVLRLEDSPNYGNRSDEVVSRASVMIEWSRLLFFPFPTSFLMFSLQVALCAFMSGYVCMFSLKQPLFWQVSCVEHLCDLLCYQLDLASFVACVNSGRSWSLKSSLLLSGKEYLQQENEDAHWDPFVENFVLERLSVQSPLRVNSVLSFHNRTFIV